MASSMTSGVDHDNGLNAKKSQENDGVDERRNQNRRQLECDGYVYLPAVGWYCRRLQNRRENDIFPKTLV